MNQSKPEITDILPGREVIFEFYQLGAITKVNAMDTRTLTEITIQCPASTSEDIMKRNALKRLNYVLKKKKSL